MKKIVLYFYSCSNLGDDLFVKMFAEHFRECRIKLITNPRCVPKGLGSNVSIHPHSLGDLVFKKLESVFGEESTLGKQAKKWNEACFHRIAQKADAYVYIGGSIFMQHSRDLPPMDFSREGRPEFGIIRKPRESGNTFVIGANLGPAYYPEYWESVRGILDGYTHVCLRDWASFCQVQDLSHVQYAPDVLFLVPQPQGTSEGTAVVVSLVEMERHTSDETVIQAYYQLMAQTIRTLLERNIPVTMVSFCEWEGDLAAIEKVKCLLPQDAAVHTVCYNGESQAVLEAIAGASFVIASRFHSMILGISYGKPVFPIAYNCKTEHYLQDLDFAGNFAKKEDLPSLTPEDVLYNCEHKIITDCSQHKRHAADQFRALRDFLGLETAAEV